MQEKQNKKNACESREVNAREFAVRVLVRAKWERDATPATERPHRYTIQF